MKAAARVCVCVIHPCCLGVVVVGGVGDPKTAASPQPAFIASAHTPSPSDARSIATVGRKHRLRFFYCARELLSLALSRARARTLIHRYRYRPDLGRRGRTKSTAAHCALLAAAHTREVQETRSLGHATRAFCVCAFFARDHDRQAIQLATSSKRRATSSELTCRITSSHDSSSANRQRTAAPAPPCRVETNEHTVHRSTDRSHSLTHYNTLTQHTRQP